MADSFLRVRFPTIGALGGRALLVALASVAWPLLAEAQVIPPTAVDPNAPKQSAPKPAAPKPAAPAKPAAPKPAGDAGKSDAGKSDAGKSDAGKSDAGKTDQPAAAADDRPDPLPWIKLCSKDQDKRNVCLVAKELRSGDGKLVASVALRDIEGDAKKVLLIAVPPVVLIQPGMRVQVDKGKQLEAKYTICFPNACYAEMEVADQTVADMKKGRALIVTSLNVQQKPMSFPFLLSTFKGAVEGPGIDPSAGQQSQEQLQQELQKRAEEAAKKLGTDAAKPADAPKP